MITIQLNGRPRNLLLSSHEQVIYEVPTVIVELPYDHKLHIIEHEDKYDIVMIYADEQEFSIETVNKESPVTVIKTSTGGEHDGTVPTA